MTRRRTAKPDDQQGENGAATPGPASSPGSPSPDDQAPRPKPRRRAPPLPPDAHRDIVLDDDAEPEADENSPNPAELAQAETGPPSTLPGSQIDAPTASQEADSAGNGQRSPLPASPPSDLAAALEALEDARDARQASNLEQAALLKAERKARKELKDGIASTFTGVQNVKKLTYLVAFALTGNRMKAAKAAGVHPSLAYHAGWRLDEAFQAGIARAERMYGELILESELDRRAVEGIWKPVGWHQGVAGGYLKTYSDLLLMFRMKKVLPEYREVSEVRGSVLHGHIDMSRWPDDLIARVMGGEDPRSVLASLPAQGAQLLNSGAVPARPSEPIDGGEV